MRSISASGANTAAILPLSSTDEAGHLAAARAHRLERVGERQRAGGDQRAVLAEAVPHHHVRHDAVGGEQAGERRVGGQHGRLRDGGLPQVVFRLARQRPDRRSSTKM